MAVVEVFVAAVDPRLVPGLDRAALAPALAAHLDAAHAAWPALHVPDDEFVRHLARCLDPDDPVPVERLRAADLYLALACARGDADAVTAFVASLFVEIEHAGAAARAAPDLVAETRAHLQLVFFVGAAGRAPATRDYAGRGDLRGWVRVSALRHMIRAQTRARREVPLGDEALYAALSPAEDPELGYIRALYQDAFADAFRQALADLGQRDKSLLRYQLVDGLTIDDIGALHGVHRSTASRWLTTAREALADATRAVLAARLGIPRDDIDSIIRLVRSRLDVSLERLLVEP